MRGPLQQVTSLTHYVCEFAAQSVLSSMCKAPNSPPGPLIFTPHTGSFLSSALYFGTYESMKELWAAALPPLSQPLAPSLAAISGNAASSLIFVPKEVLKQRCQIGQLANGQKAIGLMRDIVRTEGIGVLLQPCSGSSVPCLCSCRYLRAVHGT